MPIAISLFQLVSLLARFPTSHYKITQTADFSQTSNHLSNLKQVTSSESHLSPGLDTTSLSFSISMGANESMATGPQEAAGVQYKTMRSDQYVSSTCNQVIAFHSPSQWKYHFDAAKDSNQLMVIDFTATWCGPCRFIDPYVKDFAAQFPDVIFVKIDVDELPMVAAEFGAQALPAFVLIKKGISIDKVVGVKVEELRKKIENHKT